MTLIATLIFVIGILGLFLLDRDWGARTSKALWIPVLWLSIAASRSLSAWLQTGRSDSPDQYMDGSPLDRNFFTALLVIGVFVLFSRFKTVVQLLRANPWVVAFALYCAISISWSDYPQVAFRRWIKSLGDFVMILIVLTDPDRLTAIKRVFARVGFVLLPLSVLFIKYYPELGRAYSRWEGAMFSIGVTEDKNMLGMTCLIFGLGSVWRLVEEFFDSRRGRILLTHGTVIAMTLWLLWRANSMTSLSCFVLGSAAMVATSVPGITRKRVHLLVVAVLACCVAAVFLEAGNGVLDAMGRNSTLTGRTELWSQLVPMAVNPILGTGFESFWLGDRLEKLWKVYWWRPNESHNGYLEVYLNLGWVGVSLLAVLLVTGYRNILRIFNWRQDAGPLRLALFVVAIAYNLTEAAMRTLNPVWIFFMLSIIALPEPEVAESETAQPEMSEVEEAA